MPGKPQFTAFGVPLTLILIVRQTASAAKKPNVVFILTDNHRAWTLRKIIRIIGRCGRNSQIAIRICGFNNVNSGT